MIQLTSTPPSEGSAESAEMVDLFAIDDVTYQVPAGPRVNLVLRYLTNLRRIGPFLADAQLLEDMLGEKGYRALCDFDDLGRDGLAEVTGAVVKLALGALERNPGNGESGSTKSGG